MRRNALATLVFLGLVTSAANAYTVLDCALSKTPMKVRIYSDSTAPKADSMSVLSDVYVVAAVSKRRWLLLESEHSQSPLKVIGWVEAKQFKSINKINCF